MEYSYITGCFLVPEINDVQYNITTYYNYNQVPMDTTTTILLDDAYQKTQESMNMLSIEQLFLYHETLQPTTNPLNIPHHEHFHKCKTCMVHYKRILLFCLLHHINEHVFVLLICRTICNILNNKKRIHSKTLTDGIAACVYHICLQYTLFPTIHEICNYFNTTFRAMNTFTRKYPSIVRRFNFNILPQNYQNRIQIYAKHIFQKVPIELMRIYNTLIYEQREHGILSGKSPRILESVALYLFADVGCDRTQYGYIHISEQTGVKAHTIEDAVYEYRRVKKKRERKRHQL